MLDDKDLHELLVIMHYYVGQKMTNATPDTSYWGFCDGKNLYIRHNYSFYQLERKDANFYIAPTLDAMRRNVGRSGWSLLTDLAGLTMSVVVAVKTGVYLEVPETFKPIDVPSVLLWLNNYEVLGLELDWDTGDITY